MRERLLTILLIVSAIVVVAGNAMYVPQDNKSRRQRTADNSEARQSEDKAKKDTLAINAQPILDDDEIIPDSLLHPRWDIQRTSPITFDDLTQQPADLNLPDNMKQNVVYNDTLDRYVIGSKIGGTYVNAPIMMTTEEYMKWSERQMINDFYRSKNEEVVKNKGKE